MELTPTDPNMVLIHCGICQKTWWALDPAAPCSDCAYHELIAQLSPHVLQEIDALVRANRKIEAIHMLKNAISIGLKEAKDFVDSRA
jgi:ribosomal protein L7/L12